MLEVTLVIPTKNEEKNISDVLDGSVKALSGTNFEIIIIDDSNDKTPAIVQRASKRNHRIRFFKQKGKGLGNAYKQGFKLARGRITIQMDADLSHNPSDIKKLLKAIKKADAAIYVNDKVIRVVQKLLIKY